MEISKGASPSIAVIYHIFYEDSLNSIQNELSPLLIYDPLCLFNICSETPGKSEMAAELQKLFPSSHIIFTSNKGKDIGGKLALLELLLQLGNLPGLLLFLHDKKSLQALKSATWKQDLLKILQPGEISSLLKIFDTKPHCGIVATTEYILTEPAEGGYFSGINAKQLESLTREYSITPKDFRFVAGTMFWARSEPILSFFSKNNPLQIRKRLESGNVLDNFSGTITHAWERLLSWIVTSGGFNIEGI